MNELSFQQTAMSSEGLLPVSAGEFVATLNERAGKRLSDLGDEGACGIAAGRAVSRGACRLCGARPRGFGPRQYEPLLSFRPRARLLRGTHSAPRRFPSLSLTRQPPAAAPGGPTRAPVGLPAPFAASGATPGC